MVQALLRATDAQKEIIAQNYAKHDDVAVQRIKQLYSDLNIKQVLRSFIHSFFLSFFLSFFHSFIHSLLHSLLHSFLHSFLRSSFGVHVYRNAYYLPPQLSSLVISPININAGV